MWPFDLLTGKSGPTTEDLTSGGWKILAGDLSGGSETWEDLSQKELAQVYQKNALVHACIRTVATSAAEAPLQVGQVDEEDNFEAVDHEIAELVADPNEFYDYRMFMFYVVSRQLATGRSLIWKWRNRAGSRINELWPLPTHWVGIKTGSGSQLIQEYKVWQASREDIDVPPEDMVNSYYPDPASTYKAIGPLQAASRDYQLDKERSNYVAEMMSNLVVPGLAITLPKGMSSEQRKSLRSQLVDRAGKGHRGGTITLEGEGGKAELMNPLADLDLPGLITMTEARICSAFNVPAEMVGARVGLENSTYSNKAEARQSFYKDTMVPLWRGLQSTLTRSLLWQEGYDDLELRFDLSGIDELQTGLSEQAERAATLYEAGIISRNEARAMVDKQPTSEDYRLTPVGGVEEAIEEGA